MRWGKKSTFPFIFQTIFSVPRYLIVIIRFSFNCIQQLNGTSTRSKKCIKLLCSLEGYKVIVRPNNTYIERLSVEWSMTTFYAVFNVLWLANHFRIYFIFFNENKFLRASIWVFSSIENEIWIVTIFWIYEFNVFVLHS